jgi:exopolysaccharide biosynthesis polyprenyl glycosylphosphotransferase
MRNNATFAYAILLVLGDFLALVAAFSAAYVLRVKVDPRPVIEQIPAMDYLQAFLAILPLWILVHAFIGLYGPSVYERRFSEIGRLAVGSFMGILVVIGYDFVTNGTIFPARLVPVYGLGLGFGFLLLFRTMARITRRVLYRFGVGISNVVIVGNTGASENLATTIGHTKTSGFKVLAVVGSGANRFKSYTSFEDAIKHLRSPIHAVIQTELYKDQDKNNEILRYSQEHHASYRFVPGNSDLFVGNIDVELFAGLPVVAVHQTALIGWGRVVKRIFDGIFGTLALFVALPFMAIIAILIALFDSRGPIFFKQTRLTRFNREFSLYKFRTMKQKYSGKTPEAAFAAMGKPELIKKYRDNGDFLTDDPRVSRIGRFLRRTSLDELPQLINVVKGDTSLVGPRSLVPQELSEYERRHTILSVKSGLTGLAQVSGRRDIGFDERRKLDMYYVQNWSFWMDLGILIKTLRVVITGSGAK